MSKLLPTDSIRVYQHPTTRMYVAILLSNPTTNSGVAHASVSEAVRSLTPNSVNVISPSWLLVDTLTSDIYPELFL